jgi:hypothetical protein
VEGQEKEAVSSCSSPTRRDGLCLEMRVGRLREGQDLTACLFAPAERRALPLSGSSTANLPNQFRPSDDCRGGDLRLGAPAFLSMQS